MRGLKWYGIALTYMVMNFILICHYFWKEHLDISYSLAYDASSIKYWLEIYQLNAWRIIGVLSGVLSGQYLIEIERIYKQRNLSKLGDIQFFYGSVQQLAKLKISSAKGGCYLLVNCVVPARDVGFHMKSPYAGSNSLSELLFFEMTNEMYLKEKRHLEPKNRLL